MQREKVVTSDPTMQKYFEVIERNSQMLLRLVESLLTLSKFDSGSGVLVKERVHLNKVIDNATFALQPAAQKAGISITLSTTGNYYVLGDESQLSQVFINLISNAVKFGRDGASVDVVISSNDSSKEAVVTIRDYGIGIPPEDLTHLFTRFFRAGNVNGALFDGAGLGLSIVAQVLHNHGGRVDVQSIEGSGSTFTVFLPIYQEGGVNE